MDAVAAAERSASIWWDKRTILTALLCLVIGVNFWLGSRYPDLGEKAKLGGEVVLEDPLGFEAYFTVAPTESLVKRIAMMTVNWIQTNRRGMTFGILFAAAIMTLLSLLRQISFTGIMPNTFLGMLIGAPLGVCVNCAAPIASGLHAAGVRLETMLAAMISSPTLNVVILTMLFSLFPLPLALMKIALTLFFLVVVIPLLVRFVFSKEQLAMADAGKLAPKSNLLLMGEALPAAQKVGWLGALNWLGRQFARNLWFIVKRTVPLMLLAGFLGVVAITILPWDTITGELFYRRQLIFYISMGFVAVIGLFLPVPIAFDVVVSAALLESGVPEGHVMILLFTLGSFSIYSFFIVWQSISARVAIMLSVAFVVLGIGGGVAVHEYGRRVEPQKWLAAWAGIGTTNLLKSDGKALPAGAAADMVLADLAKHKTRWSVTTIEGPAGVRVEQTSFAPASASGTTLFERHYGEEFGLVRVDHLPFVQKFSEPYSRSLPIAAGDVHNDGWVDLLFGSDRGIYLFANRGGRDFVLQRIDIPELAEMYVGNAAFADLNGDGWLDIFLSGFRTGNYIIYNDHGKFDFKGLKKLPASAANLTQSVAFADLDGDGRLDIITGNWSSGIMTQFPPEESRNAILWNRPAGFEQEMLPDLPGETLSILASDINLDGRIDFVVGNDFNVPDYFYLGRSGGGFKMLTPQDGIVPHSATTTMSIDSADLDNDLKPELFFGQISGRSPRQQRRVTLKGINDICSEYKHEQWRQRCEQHVALHNIMTQARNFRDPRRCLAIADPLERGGCVAQLQMRYSRKQRDISGCDRIPAAWDDLAHLCRYSFKKPESGARREGRRGIQQILNDNVLLVPTVDGKYVDRAKEMGLDIGGWTWNAKFADLDNDEYQDVYIANGRIGSDRHESKLFYRNDGGKRFLDQTRQAGLESFLTNASYVYADIDNDGDLDIITASADGPIWLYKNTTQRKHHAIAFEFVDSQGNRQAVGSRVVIHYGDGEQRHQMREIKASGGFISTDPATAHFGLGQFSLVSKVEIFWPGGESTTLKGKFTAGHRYRITRGQAQVATVR